MYRNLEEDRKTTYAAAETSDGATCVCQCKTPTERGPDKVAAGDQSAVDLQVYYDYHGEPKP